MKLLALIFGDIVWHPWSFVIATLLRARGVRVGRNFYIEGTAILKLRGSAAGIVIGDDVKIMGDVDLRNRENGRITIGDRCKLDHRVRLVAAREAHVRIGEDTNLGAYGMFNCGADVTLGKKCLVAAFVNVQSSAHGIEPGSFVKDQPHTHSPIMIGDGVWLGGHSSVLPGVTIGNGAVIGAKAVVTSDIPDNAIAVGVPARVIRLRGDAR